MRARSQRIHHMGKSNRSENSLYPSITATTATDIFERSFTRSHSQNQHRQMEKVDILAVANKNLKSKKEFLRTANETWLKRQESSITCTTETKKQEKGEQEQEQEKTQPEPRVGINRTNQEQQKEEKYYITRRKFHQQQQQNFKKLSSSSLLLFNKSINPSNNISNDETITTTTETKALDFGDKLNQNIIKKLRLSSFDDDQTLLNINLHNINMNKLYAVKESFLRNNVNRKNMKKYFGKYVGVGESVGEVGVGVTQTNNKERTSSSSTSSKTINIDGMKKLIKEEYGYDLNNDELCLMIRLNEVGIRNMNNSQNCNSKNIKNNNISVDLPTFINLLTKENVYFKTLDLNNIIDVKGAELDDNEHNPPKSKDSLNNSNNNNNVNNNSLTFGQHPEQSIFSTTQNSYKFNPAHFEIFRNKFNFLKNALNYDRYNSNITLIEFEKIMKRLDINDLVIKENERKEIFNQFAEKLVKNDNNNRIDHQVLNREAFLNSILKQENERIELETEGCFMKGASKNDNNIELTEDNLSTACWARKNIKANEEYKFESNLNPNLDLKTCSSITEFNKTISQAKEISKQLKQLKQTEHVDIINDLFSSENNPNNQNQSHKISKAEFREKIEQSLQQRGFNNSSQEYNSFLSYIDFDCENNISKKDLIVFVEDVGGAQVERINRRVRRPKPAAEKDYEEEGFEANSSRLNYISNHDNEHFKKENSTVPLITSVNKIDKTSAIQTLQKYQQQKMHPKISEMFRSFDQDKDGYVSKKEFIETMQKTASNITKSEISNLANYIVNKEDTGINRKNNNNPEEFVSYEDFRKKFSCNTELLEVKNKNYLEENGMTALLRGEGIGGQKKNKRINPNHNHNHNQNHNINKLYSTSSFSNKNEKKKKKNSLSLISSNNSCSNEKQPEESESNNQIEVNIEKINIPNKQQLQQHKQHQQSIKDNEHLIMKEEIKERSKSCLSWLEKKKSIIEHQYKPSSSGNSEEFIPTKFSAWPSHLYEVDFSLIQPASSEATFNSSEKHSFGQSEKEEKNRIHEARIRKVSEWQSVLIDRQFNREKLEERKHLSKNYNMRLIKEQYEARCHNKHSIIG